MRVHWFGFGSDEDSWESVTHITKLRIERSAKRNKIAIEELWLDRR
jgi:hypothetical protein